MKPAFSTMGACCGVVEYYYLRSADTPQDAVWYFCQWAHSNDGLDKLPGYVIFSGVEKFLQGLPPQPVRRHYDDDHSYARGQDNWQKDCRFGYASALAKYIRQNKLGAVSWLKRTPNRQNHPDHIIQAFIWTPDPAKIKEWWAQNKGIRRS